MKFILRMGFSSGASTEVAFIRSCNGMVFIDFKNRRVVKACAPQKAEPLFIENELAAQKSLPGNTPMIYESGVFRDDIAYTLSEYLLPKSKASFRTWRSDLVSVLPLLFKNYIFHGLKSIPAETHRIYLLSELSHCEGLQKFTSLTREIRILFETLVPSEPVDKKIHLLFCHGDLVPNNLIKADKVYLFDWANGGWQNAYYDLMMQQFYFKNSPLWKDFGKIALDDLDRYTFGFAAPHLQMLLKNFQISDSLEDIKKNFIYAIVELVIKNCRRYQFHPSELTNREDMLQTAFSILKLLHQSLNKSIARKIDHR